MIFTINLFGHGLKSDSSRIQFDILMRLSPLNSSRIIKEVNSSENLLFILLEMLRITTTQTANSSVNFLPVFISTEDQVFCDCLFSSSSHQYSNADECLYHVVSAHKHTSIQRFIALTSIHRANHLDNFKHESLFNA